MLVSVIQIPIWFIIMTVVSIIEGKCSSWPTYRPAKSWTARREQVGEYLFCYLVLDIDFREGTLQIQLLFVKITASVCQKSRFNHSILQPWNWNFPRCVLPRWTFELHQIWMNPEYFFQDCFVPGVSCPNDSLCSTAISITGSLESTTYSNNVKGKDSRVRVMFPTTNQSFIVWIDAIALHGKVIYVIKLNAWMYEHYELVTS